MKPINRDLLVLVKDEYLNEEAMEVELELLNQLLFYFETIDNLCKAHEVFDMNRYRIIEKELDVQRILNQKEVKPFVFICNKN